MEIGIQYEYITNENTLTKKVEINED